MNKNRKVKVLCIIGFFCISILGTLLHFTYELSNENVIVGVFSATNESVWEHLKLAVMPIFIFAIVEYLVLKDSRENIFFSLIVKIAIPMIMIPTVFYIYKSIVGKSIVWVDISNFFVSIIISQIAAYYILIKEGVSRKLEAISLTLSLLVLMFFIVFTFIPPKIEIFRDSTTNTYGILKTHK